MPYGNPNLLPDSGSDFEGGTSTWYGATNCTLSVVTGQFATGSQSLRLTATAAGSISASTPLVSGVVAGAEYVARVPFRLSVAGVKTLSIRILFYADGGSTIGYKDASITTPATGTGWLPANYPVVTMVAPATAKNVRVVATVSNMAAGEYVNVDDVYIGQAVTREGNLLDFNASSMETDTSGWAVTNGTLARTNGYLATGVGYYCGGATSAAAGNMPIRTSATYPVTPGKEYAAYGAVQSPTASLTAYFELRWVDAGGAEIQVNSTSATVTSTVTRLAAVGVAPANATGVRVWMRPQATAAGQLFAFDDVTLAVAPNYAGNLLTFDEYSTEGSLPPWNISNATAQRSYFTSVITQGYYALRMVPTSPGMITGQLPRLLPVTPGETYQARAIFYRYNTDTAQVVTSSARVRIDWYDAAGNLVQADDPDQFYTTESALSWYGTINSETRSCPADATHARIGWEIDSTSPLIGAWVVDNFSLAPAEPEYLLTVSDEAGSVSLQINTVIAEADTVTIQRVDENGRKSPLRGYGISYDAAPYTPAPILVEDYEVPLGTRVWYAVTWGNSTYRLFTRSVAGPVLADGDYVWFKSPGIPALNTTVMMEAPPSWSRAARSASYDIVGRKNALSISDVRAGRTSSITILIWDPAANALFDSLLDSGMTSLIQAMPGYGIEGNLYVSIGNVTCDQLSEDAREDGWRWTLEIAERDRPGGGMQGSSGATWQDIFDGYADWDAVFDTHESWTDVLTKG